MCKRLNNNKSYAWCLRCNIFSAWFLDIRIYQLVDKDDQATKHLIKEQCFVVRSWWSKSLILSKAEGLGRPFWFHIFFNKAFLVLSCSFLHLGCFGLDLSYIIQSIYANVWIINLWYNNYDVQTSSLHSPLTRIGSLVLVPHTPVAVTLT